MVPSSVVIEVLGRFDEGVAHAVRSALVRGVEAITIDFRKASRIDPPSLALLARELAQGRASAVSIKGLSGHQQHLLRYLSHVATPPPPDPLAKA